MATFLQIRQMVRTMSLLTTDDLTLTELTVMVNEGLFRLAATFDWPWLEASADISITGGDPSGTLPADFARLRVLLLKGETTRLAEISASEAWERWGDDLPSGTPRVYWFEEEAIKIAPVPAANDTLTIHYWKNPTALAADGNTPDFASQFHYILADYALWRVWQREEDFVKAAQYEQAFNTTLNDMARFYFNQGLDYPMVYGESADTHQRRSTRLNMPWLDGA